MPEISIIVPVYNAEKQLKRCIESILSQTFTNFELLLVDDGSKDRSGNICDEYAKKDSRVRVFHKDNEGVSSARQLGIDEAVGVYSIHVDADDWIEPTMLLDMNAMLDDDTDMVVADFYVNDGKKQKVRIQPNKENPIEFLKAVLEDKAMGCLWNKLIRHSLYDNIKFDTDITYCEDVLVLSQILYKTNVKIVFLHSPYYHYEQVETSITHRINKNTFNVIFAFITKLEFVLQKNKYSDMGILNVKRISTLIRMVKSQIYSYKELISVYKSIIQHNESLGEYSFACKKLCFKFWLILFPYRSYRLISFLKYIKKQIKSYAI